VLPRLPQIIVLPLCLWCGIAYASGLLDAAKQNEIAAVTASIASGADVNQRGGQGDTPLHWAAFNGNSELVRSLIYAGGKVNERLANGNTPLHLAAYKGHTAAVKALLEGGADATLRNRDGKTPLDLARNGQHQTTVALLDRGVDRSRSASSQNKPLRAAPLPPLENPVLDSPGADHRIQLVAVSSEERANRALIDYRRRFADILPADGLTVEKAGQTTGPRYRVQYGPLPFGAAKSLCAELERREQPCLVRTVRAR
jgi:hypothetical protein